MHGVTKQTCPDCGMVFHARQKITVFTCCSKNSVKIDASKKITVDRIGERYQEKHRLDRPGDVLYRLLKSTFGIEPPPGCGCKRMQGLMNSLGVDRCEEQIDSLTKQLRENAKQFNWKITVIAAVHATMSGALRWLNPLDPWRSIIREACRLTKEACDEQAKHQQGNGSESV